MNRALVVCIGNDLVADDAVGPRIHDALRDRGIPPKVGLKRLGVGGIALLDELHGEELLVIVDAVGFGEPPGTLYVLEGSDFAVTEGMPVTSHDIGLLEVISVGSALYPERIPKRIVLVGVEGACFDQLGGAMTPAVAAAVRPAVEKVLELVDRVCD